MNQRKDVNAAAGKPGPAGVLNQEQDLLRDRRSPAELEREEADEGAAPDDLVPDERPAG